MNDLLLLLGLGALGRASQLEEENRRLQAKLERQDQYDDDLSYLSDEQDPDDQDPAHETYYGE